jgi:acylphosphatase
MPDGSVSAVFSGDREMISILEGYCRKIPSAEISSVESESIEDSDFNGFEIIRD